MGFSKLRVALIGCGMISAVYLKNLKKLDVFDLVGCSDLLPERARTRAEEYGIRAMTNEEIFSDPSIDMVINTTYPLAHYEVARAALLAGKHVYTEKMICETNGQAHELLALAQAKGLFFGGAPDTFLGGGMQMARRLLDSGAIGEPTMLEAFLARSYRHERFYTGAEKRFAFCRHGGILFDMGAYYLTGAVFLLGAIREVTGFTAIRRPDRVYENPNSPLCGKPMTVESPNHATGALRFAGDVLGTLTMTSECGGGANRFVLYGTDGYIDLGDPNNYDATIRLVGKSGRESVIETTFGYTGDNFRAIGAADAAYAILTGRAPRCSGALCCHVLEAALGIAQASATGTAVRLTGEVGRPAPLAPGYTEYPELVFRAENASHEERKKP